MRTTQFMGLSDAAEQFVIMGCKHQEIVPDYSKELNEAVEEFKCNFRNTNTMDWLVYTTGFQDAAKKLTGRTVPISKKLKPVEGMFDEVVHVLKEYETYDGIKIEEYVQAQPWSSGPCIFLALRNAETKEPILQTLWDEEEIDNA